MIQRVHFVRNARRANEISLYRWLQIPLAVQAHRSGRSPSAESHLERRGMRFICNEDRVDVKEPRTPHINAVLHGSARSVPGDQRAVPKILDAPLHLLRGRASHVEYMRECAPNPCRHVRQRDRGRMDIRPEDRSEVDDGRAGSHRKVRLAPPQPKRCGVNRIIDQDTQIGTVSTPPFARRTLLW